MQNDLFDRLRAIGSRMTTVWPDMAGDLVSLHRARDLTLRDLGVLMLLAPGEHVGRVGVEALVGADEADIVIGALDGHGLVVEDPQGLRLTERGREFVAQVVDLRAKAACRVLNTLPEPARNAIVQGLEDAARALPRAEALEKLQPA